MPVNETAVFLANFQMAQYAAVGLAGAAVYMIYLAGKKKTGQRGLYTDYAAGQDGNDITWNGGPIIEVSPEVVAARTGLEATVPACKKWDVLTNSYLYMNDKLLDAGQSACFASVKPAGDSIWEKRSYTTSDGSVTFTGSPLDFAGGDRNTGQCMFMDSGSLTAKPTQAVVNRNQQLCFAADPTGTLWKEPYYANGAQLPGQWPSRLNPRLSITEELMRRTDPNKTIFWTLLPSEPNPPPTRCEAAMAYRGSRWIANPSDLGFFYTPQSKTFDSDRAGCLSSQNMRYVVDDQYAIYKSPFTNELVSLPIK